MSDSDFVDQEEYQVNIYAEIDRNLRSYSGFVSLIRELIQNSDDSSARGKNVEVELHFLKDKLVLKNNTAFNDDDWEKIKEIGSRNKEDSSNKTGRFGIGFTSVFKICDNLNIHSKNVSKNLNLNLVNTGKKWRKYSLEKTKYSNGEEITEFEFFWRTEDSEARRQIKAEIITPNEINLCIDEVTKNINKDVHFLNNISKLVIYNDRNLIQEIKIQKESFYLCNDVSKDVKTISVDGNKRRILIYHKNLTEYFKKELESGISRRKQFILSIAVDCSSIQKGRVFCTLPTELKTGFAFDINCDFQPNQDRKHLIFEEDDAKGRYNTKIFNFIPNLLHEILENLKEETSVEMLYEILSSSESGGQFKHLFVDFINLVKENDAKIIHIDNKWYRISETNLCSDKKMLSLLTRINYPVIPEKHLKFNKLFIDIGIKDFDLNDLIKVIQEKVPSSVPFKESFFQNIDELFIVHSFICHKSYINYKDKLQSLNIFLTSRGNLENSKKSIIVEMPRKLDLIKDDLPVKQINRNLIEKFSFLRQLGVSKFGYDQLIEIIQRDFLAIKYPIKISEAKPYINNKQKLLLIFSFLKEAFEQYIKYLKSKEMGYLFLDGKTVYLQDQKFKNFELNANRIVYLPLVLSENGNLYTLSSNKVFDLDSEGKIIFANMYGLEKLDTDIKNELQKFNLVPHLKLQLIVNYLEFYFKSRTAIVSDDNLILFYQLISESKSQLTGSNIDKLKRIPLFKNNRHSLCSLNNNGREMLLQGNYPLPEGILIDEILDEFLINNIPDYPNFKKEILESIFNIKKLTFGRFVKSYFVDIFNRKEIKTDDKLKLISKLNDEIRNLKNNDPNNEIHDILLKSNLVFCNDGKFHCPSRETIFFKSTEFDELFGENYLYPDYAEISEYTYLFEKLGVNKTLDEDKIVEYIIKCVESKQINKDLIERMRIIFVYINQHWESFNQKEKFKELAKIEWLPASGFFTKLYKPCDLYLQNSGETQNTKPFLSEFGDILYLDISDALLREKSNSSWLKKDLINIIELNNVQRIPTEKIIENLRLLSKGKKIIENELFIYSELDKRAQKNPNSVLPLRQFNSLYIKHKSEEKPRYLSTLEVFRENQEMLYGKYIGYLSPQFVGKCTNLLNYLKVLNVPDASAIKDILKKIDTKYANNSYFVSDENDKRILSNCLEQLSNKVESPDFKDSLVLDLKVMHILCNNDSKLITPEYAILDDNHIISTQFEEKLGDRFVKYNKEHFNILKKLKIKKISQEVNKKLVTIPVPSDLKINPRFSRKLEYFIQLLPRIKFAEEESSQLNGSWRDIDEELNVYDFENLNVLKYLLIDDRRYEAKTSSSSCYIEKDEALIYKIYINGSDKIILDSLANELFETIHSNLNRNYISTFLALLGLESYEEMDRYLTEILHYPVLEKKANTLLNIDETIEYSSENDVAEDEKSNRPLEFGENNIKKSFGNGSTANQKAECDYTIDRRISYNNDSQSTSFNNGQAKSKKWSNENDVAEDEKSNGLSEFGENNIEKSFGNDSTANQKAECGHTIDRRISSSNNDSQSTSFNNGQTKSKKWSNENDANKDLDLPFTVGRTNSPTKEMDFNEEIGEQYAQRNHPTNQENHEKYLIDEKLDPMSLEDEKRFNDTVIFEIENEIENIREDNIKRTYTSQLRKIKENTVSKLEVKDFYKGKCQICGFNFRKKDGSMYCITVSLLEKRNGGIRHPANYLCLCPNHAALLKYSYVAGLDKKSLVNIKNNKIKFNTNDSEYEINYHPMHFRMLKELLKRGRHN